MVGSNRACICLNSFLELLILPSNSHEKSTIRRSLPPPKILGKKPKATTKVTLQEPPKVSYFKDNLEFNDNSRFNQI